MNIRTRFSDEEIGNELKIHPKVLEKGYQDILPQILFDMFHGKLKFELAGYQSKEDLIDVILDRCVLRKWNLDIKEKWKLSKTI